MRSLAAVTGLVAALLAAAPPAAAQPRVIVLNPEQLTSQVARRMPQRSCLFEIACVTLSDPRVELKDRDPRLYVAARAVPELGAQALGAGVVEVAGRLRYEPTSGAFFIDDPAILRLDFPDLEPSQVAAATELTRGLLVEYFRQVPVWTLDERDSQQALAKLVLRSVEVRDRRLRFTFGE
ncbi:MAG: DUF1439 domain-containing protein [Lautropia sp.]